MNKYKLTQAKKQQLCPSKLPARQTIYLIMAAGVAARVLDIRKEIIRDSLSDFQMLSID